MTARSTQKSSILKTVDEFMAAVPWDEWRTVLVNRRQHGGRTYVRLRTWNNHRRLHVWYPSKRSFIIPIGNAKWLSDAIRDAAAGQASPKPEWLTSCEIEEEKRPDRIIIGGMTLAELEKKRLECFHYMRESNGNWC